MTRHRFKGTHNPSTKSSSLVVLDKRCCNPSVAASYMEEKNKSSKDLLTKLTA